MYTFFKADIKDIDEIYEIMDHSFPDNEMRTKEKLTELAVNNPYYNLHGVKNEKGKILGFIIVWNFDDFIFLENFATDKKIRGQGIGSLLLDHVIDLYQKDVILEVELPLDEMKKRRIKFYERHQFIYNDFDYLMPPLREGDDFFPLKIMSYKKSFTKEEFEPMKQKIYTLAYGQSL